MIRLEAIHRPALEAALAARPELAMFPLDNLRRHGMSGGHPRAMSFWADDPGAPRAILGLSGEGMVLPFAPHGLNGVACARILRGRPLMGFSGPAAPVRALLAATGLAGRAARIDADEPQFLLSLGALTVPDGPGHLAPVSRHRDVAVDWRCAYVSELHASGPARDAAEADVDRWIAADSHRMLAIDGRPAAMTGFNAALPDMVQVGGVYTPPAARNRGLARRAVALHLAEARDRGVARATLFAASATAVACYRPLGFERVGDYALVLLDTPMTP